VGIEYGIESVDVEVVQDVICDICGKSCLCDETQEFEYSQLLAKWGYGSALDGQSWDQTFCAECSAGLMKVINSQRGFLESTSIVKADFKELTPTLVIEEPTPISAPGEQLIF
jgi:hypothetical protein